MGRAAANATRLAEFVLSYARLAQESVRDGRNPELLAELAPIFGGERSTRQFWPFVLDGDVSAVGPLQRLGVPTTSWLWRRIVVDALTECASWRDAEFAARIDRLLAALQEQRLVLDEGLGIILGRLAKIPSADEHIPLRDLAVERWGSPLIPAKRPFWYHHTTEAARRMVAGWMARRLIASFFGSMAGEHADPRRTAFWGRYAEHIDEFWVFLSTESRATGGEALRDMRRALAGSVRSMDDEHTNAFVMMIGQYAFVEFSTTGNALYVYPRDGLPFELARVRPAVTALKERSMTSEYLWHSGRWEERARDKVGNLTGQWVTLF
jgi:hypothetical protein